MNTTRILSGVLLFSSFLEVGARALTFAFLFMSTLIADMVIGIYYPRYAMAVNTILGIFLIAAIAFLLSRILRYIADGLLDMQVKKKMEMVRIKESVHGRAR